MSFGLQFLTSYTYSKSIDNSSGQGGARGQQAWSTQAPLAMSPQSWEINAMTGPTAESPTIGNVGRNCLRGPRQTNVDLAITKRFPFSESRNIELGAEFFNLFNEVNVANPVSNFNAVGASGKINPNTGQVISPGDFGRIISTSNNPRILQFALKFSF